MNLSFVKKGFTLIEIMLSVAVISGLIIVGTTAFYQVVSRVAVANAEETFQSSLRRAQTLARNQSRNSNWGVYLDQDASRILIYAGESYETRNTTLDEAINIDGIIDISEPVFELNFEQISGSLTPVSSTAETLTFSAQGNSRTIAITSILGSASGLASYVDQGDATIYYTVGTDSYVGYVFNQIGPHTFQVPSNIDAVDVLVVAGGGGGGNSQGFSNGGAAGGGAGGVIIQENYSVTPNALLDITVGDGGSGSSSNNTAGDNGQNSLFDSLTALGGGGGAGGNDQGNSGGSGGGSRGTTGAAATQPSSASGGLGNPGGDHGDSPGGAAATGGGGAGGPGQNLAGSEGEAGSAGGIGIEIDFSGSSTWYAGGGGSGTAQNNSPVGPGGQGGGGTGGNDSTAPTAGQASTGGGGGGGNNSRPGAAGGSGIVIIRHRL